MTPPHNKQSFEQGSFQTTRWSLVLRAGGSADEEAREALSILCEAYWYPIYAYYRRSGRGPHDAEDLTQGFFARLLKKDLLAAADPSKGKLRTYLLACARNYMLNERARYTSEQRAYHRLVSFDQMSAEGRYSAEPVDDMTPDRLYQRRWALMLLERSLQLIRNEYHRAEKADLFNALRPFLGFTSQPQQDYEALGPQLHMNANAVKTQVFRLRQRWRELLFEQVSLTLDEPTSDQIRDELSELIGCV